MMHSIARVFPRYTLIAVVFAMSVAVLPVQLWAKTPASAEIAVTNLGFSQAMATAAATEPALAEWYRTTGFAPLWTASGQAERRAALFAALATASAHGLPPARYRADALVGALNDAVTEADRARLEVALSLAYLTWAGDLTSGMLKPATIDPGILRDIHRIDPQTLLSRLANGDPQKVFDWLVPDDPNYIALMKAKIGLETEIAAGGWGETVAAASLGPGDSGPQVVALRDRLILMGYLAPTATASYDPAITAAVQAFQITHGLVAEGLAAETTLAEMNLGAEDRLKSVIVALERSRWMDIDHDARHVWVNLPDFKAQIVEAGQTVFETRVVIGKNVPDQRTPEFSDIVEHMVINPSWGVPRSIIVKEYLPLLQQNPYAVGHLQVIDGRGRVIPRDAINFTAYSSGSFPYSMRQLPSDSNALGLVKFMFPNPYNIYLHDTPSKSLFDKDIRAFSHGCIRVADPFDLAHALLSVQSSAAEEEFDAHLQTGDETTVPLEKVVPVHLVYFTAYPDDRGRISYRRDVYGRDAALFEALKAAGVALPGVQR